MGVLHRMDHFVPKHRRGPFDDTVERRMRTIGKIGQRGGIFWIEIYLVVAVF